MQAVIQEEAATKIHLLDALDGDLLRLQLVEQDFLATPDPILVEAHRFGIDRIIHRLGEIRPHKLNQDLNMNLNALTRLIIEDEKLFGAVEKHLLARGRSDDEGLHGAMRVAAHAIEGALKKNAAQLDNLLSLKLARALLMLRRHEKDFIQRQQKKYIDQYKEESRRFVRLLEASPKRFRRFILPLADTYRMDFLNLVNNTQELVVLREDMSALKHRVPLLLEKLHQQISEMERARNDQLKDQTRMEHRAMLILLPGVLFVNWLLVYFYWRMMRERQAAEVAHAEAILDRELAQTTLKSIGDGVVVTDVSGRVTDLNPVASQLLGISLEESRGQPIVKMVNLYDEDTGAPIENPIETCLESGEVVYLSGNMELRRADGVRIPIEDSAAPIRISNGKMVGAIMVFRNVSEQRDMLRRIQYQACHDSLTGLINRSAFEAVLKDVWQSCESDAAEHALVYIDLDRFKIINDTCGHHAGDELLKQITVLIRNRIRSSDVLGRLYDGEENTAAHERRQEEYLARLGGDEFALLLLACPMDAARRIASSVVENIKAFNFLWEGQTFKLGASIGIAPMNRAAGSLEEVMKNADMACFEAKNRGRSRVCIHIEHDDEIHARHREMSWVPRLHQALAEDQFILRRQAIVPVLAGGAEVMHYEVLISLQDGAEMVPPGAFLPAAERYQMMSDIDRWVVDRAFARIAEEDGDGIYAINLSGESLGDEGMLEYLFMKINEYEVAPQRVIFEITESAAIRHLQNCQGLIGSLRNLGCRFSLDDFGSGLSSFAYLRDMQVDYLKIDGQFTRNIVEDGIDRILVHSMIRMGHDLGVKVIAEFVENREILKFLKELGADYAQGWGVGRPEIWVKSASG